MDYKYLFLRYQTFRDEYLELSHKWFRGGCSWLWRFTVDNFRFLYLGEINQIRHLAHVIKQQADYIDLLRAGQAGTVTGPDRGNRAPALFSAAVRIALLPAAFLIYWVRRFWRLVRQQEYRLLISTFPPASDIQPESVYYGNDSRVFLLPESGKRFPRGLVRFRFHVSVTDGRPEPTLYINPGSGFSSEYSIPLPCHASGPQDMLLELPPDCRQLELRMTTASLHYELTDVSMTEISVPQAIRYLRTQYGYTPDDIMHALFIRKLPGVRRTLAHRISYAEWHYRYTRLSPRDRIAINTHIGLLTYTPRISLILPADKADREGLDLSLSSIRRQLYPHWEVLICCTGVPDAGLTTVLNHHERNDRRVRVVTGKPEDSGCHINDAITLVSGSFTAIVKPGDLIEEHALYLIACKINEMPDTKLIYTDHDYIDEHGRLSDPELKPDWNEELLLGKDYIGGAVFYQSPLLAGLIAERGWPPTSFTLMLRFIASITADQIHHVPYLLWHLQSGKVDHDNTDETNRAAIEEYLMHLGRQAAVTPAAGRLHIRYALPDPPPLVSLIVLTRDRVALLSNCVRGLLENTYYRNIEVIIIDNGSTDLSTLAWLEAIRSNERVRVYCRPGEFNFSALNNFAVEQARGEYIGLINNDISVIEPDWLDQMMGHLVRPEVGIVGAKLLYENGTIQHAGVIIGLGGVAGHAFRHAPRHARGYCDRLILPQQLSCVTAACLLTRKSVYRQVGGMDEVNLRVAFNDVDYCLKVRELGWKIIWTPFAELYHLESASRGSDLSKENIHRWKGEYQFMRAKWQHLLEQDPFYNPNLGIADEEFGLALPPRLIHPWERYRYFRQPAIQGTVSKQ